MTKLSEKLTPELMKQLQKQIRSRRFPRLTFELAMQFLLSDGVIPKSNLPVQSFLDLEDWILRRNPKKISISATDLKNKTGEVLDRVMAGYEVAIKKHGRVVAEMKAPKSTGLGDLDQT